VSVYSRLIDRAHKNVNKSCWQWHFRTRPVVSEALRVE